MNSPKFFDAYLYLVGEENNRRKIKIWLANWKPHFKYSEEKTFAIEIENYENDIIFTWGKKKYGITRNEKFISELRDIPYFKIIEDIRLCCSKMECFLSDIRDGRNQSAIDETPYLAKLEELLVSLGYIVHIPKPESEPEGTSAPKKKKTKKIRFWYDISVNGIPINLKLTKCKSRDNALSKTAIHSTLCHKIGPLSMNDNKFFEFYRKNIKFSRNRMTEYHYLVVNKENGEVLLKSILDIHTYKSNPSNGLQIDWGHEFKHREYVCSDHVEKGKELIETFQKSVRGRFEGSREFADADIDVLYLR